MFRSSGLNERAQGIGVAFACAFFLIGCGGARELRSSAPVHPQPVQEVYVEPASAADILAIVRESGAHVMLVNIWATWCSPCIEEFPELLRLHRQYRGRGLELILVSADFESEMPNVIAFLAKQGVNFPSYIKSGDNMEFIDTLNPTWSGALPATFIYDSTGTLRHFWEGKATYEQLEKKALEFLTSPVGHGAESKHD